MENEYKRILIINTFGIGDVLFSTPLIRALKEGIPAARIDFICNNRTQYILQNNKNIDELLIYEKDDFRDALKRSKIGFIKKLFSFIKRIRSKRYDLAIDLSLGYQISMILMLVGVKKRIGFNFRQRGKFLTDKLDIEGFDDKPVAEYYLDVLGLIGIPASRNKALELNISEDLKVWAENFIRADSFAGKKLIGLAPGGGKSWGREAAYRRWDTENFISVARQLLKERGDIFFIIFGSSEESGVCAKLETALAGSAVNLCGKLSIPQFIALVKKCYLLLCNDGGILHMSVSQGLKTVSVFGPVDHKVYGPYPPSGRHKVIIASKVGCRPCYRNFRHPFCEKHECLKEIDIDEALRITREALQS